MNDWKEESAKVDMTVADGVLWKRKRAGGRLEKLASTREDGVCLRVSATTKELTV